MTASLVHHVRSSDPVDEIGLASLPDKRLGKRGKLVAEAIRRSPAAPLPDVMANDTELTGAYRFFNNERVTPAALLKPHFDATLARARSMKECLVIHDTTAVTYGGKRSGLGRIAKGKDGFLAHVSLAVTADGCPAPLGVLATEFLVRSGAKRTLRPRRTSDDPLEAAGESARWERGFAATDKALRDASVRPIHVADREGDSYLLLSKMLENQRAFVFRMAQNRALESSADDETALISDVLKGLPVLSRRTITLGARDTSKRPPPLKKRHPSRESREAEVVITATQVTLKRPRKASAKLPKTLPVNVVRVFEPNPPEGEVPVEWLLVTREPINSGEDVERIVDIYRRRWIVEEFFKAMKTGCAIESRQFETGHALMNVFAVCVPIAWQMLLMRTLSREETDTPANRVLTPIQLMILVAASAELPKRQRPSENPTVREALLAIAALGGHLSRNGEPGWLTIARGFEYLQKLEIGYRIGSGAGWDRRS